MEWYTWIITIVLGVTLGVLFNSRKNVNYDILHNVNEKDFKDNMRKGQLIDVRKESEYNENKIKGAKNYTKAQLTGKYSKLRKDQPVFLYCNDGKKSTRIAKALAKENYKAIYILEGGLNNTKK